MTSRPNKKDDGMSPAAWMFTFSDLTLLLLTVFVMRLAAAAIDPQRLGSKVLGRPFSADSAPPPASLDQELAGSVKGALAQAAGGGAVGGGVHPGGITVREEGEEFSVILGGASFAAGSAEPSFIASEAVSALARVMRGRPVIVEISGHAGKSEGPDGGYPSAWELSLARAAAAARQMIDAGVSAQYISVAAYADLKSGSRERDEDDGIRVEILVALRKQPSGAGTTDKKLELSE